MNLFINPKNFLYLILNFFLQLTFIHSHTEVLRPRGVPLSKKSFYDPGKDFQCFDGSATIPFLLVNDDYCDCDDGSDEPGTNACSNGIFHCSNIGFIEKIIPSSRVNDGICDCCDASDEYNSSAKCPNNCLELGEQMRIERELYLELLKQGSQIRQQYIEQAKQIIEETKVQLDNLKLSLTEIENEKNSKFEIKNQAEELEKEALEKHRAKEEELRKQKEEEEAKKREEEESQHAGIAFKQLDSDKNGILTLEEMKSFGKFDKDNDGAVSDDEAKFYANGLEQLEMPAFLESSWPLVKPLFEQSQEESQASEKASNEQLTDTDDETMHDEEREATDHETESEEHEHIPPVMPEAPSTQVTLEYDENTNQLVENAKKARNEYNDAEAKFQDLQKKIRELEVILETDFGPNGEFMALRSQCFELHENEYIYKLCPFESASQRSKTGGTETSLGRWGKWIGPEQNHYEKFILEGGVQCWNGPARSVIVSVSCGSENQLTRATEPNRCEYAFDFKTPAACIMNQSVLPEGSESSGHEHTEL